MISLASHTNAEGTTVSTRRVIASATKRLGCARRTSREVRIPTRAPSLSTTGRPPTRISSMRRAARATLSSGLAVITSPVMISWTSTSEILPSGDDHVNADMGLDHGGFGGDARALFEQQRDEALSRKNREKSFADDEGLHRAI